MTKTTEHEELMQAINKQIEKSVNGGVREINKKLDDYILLDTQWKKDSQPALDNMKNLTGLGKTAFSLSLGVTAIIGAIFAVKKLFGL